MRWGGIYTEGTKGEQGVKVEMFLGKERMELVIGKGDMEDRKIIMMVEGRHAARESGR